MLFCLYPNVIQINIVRVIFIIGTFLTIMWIAYQQNKLKTFFFSFLKLIIAFRNYFPSFHLLDIFIICSDIFHKRKILDTTQLIKKLMCQKPIFSFFDLYHYCYWCHNYLDKYQSLLLLLVASVTYLLLLLSWLPIIEYFARHIPYEYHLMAMF